MAQDDVFSFPIGLAGFPEVKSYHLLEPEDGYPLKFLQAVHSQFDHGTI